MVEQGTIYVSGRDIDRRKRAEERLLQSNCELTVLNTIIAAITSSLDPEQVFQEIVEAAGA